MKKRSVGLLTIHKSINFGALLQAYSLKNKIEELGFSCNVIDLLRPIHEDYVQTDRFPLLTNISKQKSPTFATKIKRGLGKLANLGKSKTYNNKLKTRTDIFQDFEKKEMNFTPHTYHNGEELYLNPPSFDIFISGSDQIWNPFMPFNPEPYFLSFAGNEAKKISYAPSFGVDSIPDTLTNKYKEWIRSIDYISVRENQGKEIVKLLTDQPVEVVVDPTLLYNNKFWDTFTDKSILSLSNTSPYILLYTIGNSDETNKLAEKIKEYTGFKIVKIGMTPADLNTKEMEIIWDIGPREFVHLVSKASFVITSSFHGVAFSINFNKPFYSIINASKQQKNGSRIQSLLSILKLEDRTISSLTQLKKSDLNIDYSIPNRNLEEVRKKSLQYLKKTLLEESN